jgi:cellulose synthase/poly-beta-1,6-N-acetylglucosamine synthase-like glycosyltransferase
MISAAIVTRGLTPKVEALAARLLEIPCPDPEREVVVVAEDPEAGSPSERETLAERTFLVRIPVGRGLGFDRNVAVEAVTGDVIVFVDDDCWPAEDTWLEDLLEPLEDPSIDAVMSEVRIPPSTFLGDSISALGFPGGGNAGFAVMFHVDKDGFTDHLSTLGCALRRSVFERVGGFDETMTAGGEDGELSYRMCAAGMRMRFQPSALIEHEARSNLSGFARWFFRRGRAARQYARRAPAGHRIQQRLASYRRILSRNARDPKIVAIVPLLVAGVLLQQAGFAWEAARERRAR